MIIRCQSGRLLESAFVVEWCKEDDTTATRHSVTATRIDGTSVVVFEGSEETCWDYLEDIYSQLSQEPREVRRLSDALLKRTDKLDQSIRRVIDVMSRKR